MAEPSTSAARGFQQYKADVKERGKPFYPYAMFHDTVMSLVVVVRDHRPRGRLEVRHRRPHAAPSAGWLGKLYDEPADPGTINFVPRPDWYYYFLFYLLRIFKWPESVILGTVGIPTIALLLLVALPFVDLRAERRPAAPAGRDRRVDPGRAGDGHAHVQGRDRQGVARLGDCARCRRGPRRRASPETRGDRGRGALRAVGLPQLPHLSRHRWSNLGAPDLTAEGAKDKGVEFQIAHLKCPACVNPGSPMPTFAAFSDENLKQLATFLEASKGRK